MVAGLLAIGFFWWAGPSRTQDLQPSEGFFSWVEPPDPYHATLRAALVGEHRYRMCQMVVLPSFEREWVVYVVRDEHSPDRVVFKRFKKPLWSEMMRLISDDGRKKSYSVGAPAQQMALAQVKVDLDRSTASIGNHTVDLLQEVWWRLLGRTRYPVEPEIGMDGTSYLVASWKTGVGFRSGETWSPEEGSLSRGMVSLAEQLAEYGQAPSVQKEAALASNARAMLARLDKQQ